MGATTRPSPGAGRLPFAQVFAAIAGVYTAQSMIGGLTFMGVPAVLRNQGVPLEIVGMTSLVMLPWALKFIWAPWVERYRLPPGPARRTRRIIVAGEAIVALMLLAMATMAQAGHAAILIGLGVLALASATVDIACDAFAVEQLSPENRGWGNAAQVGGGYLGIVFGSGMFLSIISRAGWTAAFAALALLVALMTLPFLLVREPLRETRPGPDHKPSLFFALRRREVLLGLAVTALFETGVRFSSAMTGPLLIDAGMDLTALGALQGIGGVIAGLVGVSAGGALSRAIGARRALITAAALQAAILILVAAAVGLGSRDHLLLGGLALLQNMAMAVGFVCLYALLMGLSSLLQAGVDFTLFQCADAAVAALAGFSAGLIAGKLGYPALFGLAATCSVFAASLIPLLLQRLRPGADAPAMSGVQP